MKSTGSVIIDRPIDEVFKLTNEHVAEWSIVVVAEERDEQTPDVVGSTFRTVTEDHGRKMEFQGVVTHYDPPTFSAVQLTGDAFDIEARYTFEEADGQTRVTQDSDVDGKGFFKVMLFLFGWAMKKSSCQA
ncbi:MAG: SRPBCC family protein, partial [Planctomycetes bacterium]|nr:SRPBCC family protein [Planctomycetota bacterium]